MMATTSKNTRKNASDTSSASVDVLRHEFKRTVKKLRPSKALVIRDSTALSEACRRMTSIRLDAVLITDSDSVLCGIFTDRDLVTRVIAEDLKLDETCVSSVMTRNPVFVTSDTLAHDALKKMLQGKFRHLPVVEDGAVVSILDMKKCLYDAISYLERQAEKITGIKDIEYDAPSTSIEALRDQTFQPTLGSLIMQAFKATTVSPNDTVDIAIKKMLYSKTDYVIVTVSSKPQGILTSKDLLMRVIAKNLPLASTSVEKAMTKHVDCATLDTTLVDALHIMHDGRFCHLPVLDSERNVVGCVGIWEVIEAGFSNTQSIVSGKCLDTCTGSEDEQQSDILEARKAYPSLRLSSHFSFKLEDSKGCVHRFNCGSQSLDELASIVSLKLGEEKACLQLLYKDEEGDLILLSSDSDLELAVSFAKSLGMKMLRIYADKKGWRSVQRRVIASLLVIVGLGLLLHTRRSSSSSTKEPFKFMWNRLINLNKQATNL